MNDAQDGSKTELELELEALRARVHELEQEQAWRRRAERELQESEARYRVLVETMNEGVSVQDQRGIMVYANEKLSRMLEYDRKEMVGRPAIDFVHEDYRRTFLQEISRPARGEGGPYEIVLLAKGAKSVSTLASPMAIWGQDGEFRGSFAVFTDITDRKRVEQAFEHERNLLRTLMDSIPDYAYIKDAECRFITTNTAHLRILGLNSISEVVGKTDFDFFPQDLAEQYYASEQAVIRSGQPLFNKVERTIDRSGTTIWVMTFKAPLRDRAGNIVGIAGVSRDITQLRLAERALQESEERLRLILENSNDVAYKLNLATGAFEYISPSSLRWSGHTPEELIARGVKGYLARVHPEDRGRLLAHLQTLRARPGGAQVERPSIVEYRAKRTDGEYRWVSQSSTVLWMDDGRPLAEVGTVRDVTESKNAEEAVRAASRMEATATLAGGIAHDFNNLMVGVLGNAELLQMRFSGSPEAMRMLNAIARSAQQAGELAQQMLAFARGGKYQPSVICLNDILSDVLRLEERSFPPRIRIEQSLDPNLWNVKADPVQMGQVIMNLSVNAVEAIEDKGTITIATRNLLVEDSSPQQLPALNPGAYVRLSVSDTGKGMTQETVAHIFEPFYTTKFQGRGLGLAAAYGIVKNHGGHLVVSSELGQGSTFTVYLPVSEKQPRLPKMQTPRSAVGEETILVIDDEPVVLEVTREILERLGYRILCAHDGQEAVEIAQSYEEDIHVAVLDMGMPVMGGAQAYPLLMKARPNLKVLISSGYELDPAAQALLDAGASAFIQKPFRAHVLATTVRKALAKEPAANNAQETPDTRG